MNHYIDIRGMDSTQSWSVIKDRFYGARESSITTVTDSSDVVNYIIKMAESMGAQTSFDQVGSNFYIHLAEQTRLTDGNEDLFSPPRKVIVITRNVLGSGDENLGKILLKSFLYQLQYLNPLPKCIIFMNKGIFLAIEGSDSLECLRCLNDRGVKLFLSSTCLCYYNCKDKLIIGEMADVKEITRRMNNAKNTIVI